MGCWLRELANLLITVSEPDSAPRRGDIYWVDWNPGRGSEQQGQRPSLVISPDKRNEVMDTVVVAALTSKVRENVRAGRSPVSVFLPAGQPLEKEGSVLAFQVMTITKRRLEDYGGKLSGEQMRQVDAALRASFGL